VINFGIRVVNYALGAALSVLAYLIVRSAWRSLNTRLQTEKIALGQKINEDLGFLPAALIVCEDIRFFEHRGADLYSITRAATRFASGRSLEGASTITQQLVRVYTKDHRFSLRRKTREILLATLVDRHFSKQDQIRLYIHRAYFGWRMNGIIQAANRLGYAPPYSIEQAAEVAARLKYPEPECPSPQRQRKIAYRAEFIQTKLKKVRKLNGNSPSLEI
jgi:membrane carboxypeptidase/penicillin-binding protein